MGNEFDHNRIFTGAPIYYRTVELQKKNQAYYIISYKLISYYNVQFGITRMNNGRSPKLGSKNNNKDKNKKLID